MSSRWGKHFALVAFSLSFFLVYLYVHAASTNSISFTIAEEKSQIILVWTNFFGKKWIFTSEKWKNGNNTCIFVLNRQLLEKASSVVFHGDDLDLEDLPSQRQSWQRWVFLSMESPDDPGNLDGKQLEMSRKYNFNWTLAYNRKANFISPYGYLINPIQESTDVNSLELIETFHRRPKDAIWVKSHCRADKKIEAIVDTMKALGINIDIVEKCSFDKELSKSGEAVFFSKYRFQLAFNSSNCQDAFFYALDTSERFGIVPVVLSGTYIPEMIPSNAFITVDYENVTAIVEFMKKFRQKANDPSPFFEWHRNQFKGNIWFHPFHYICERLWNSFPDKVKQSDRLGPCLDVENLS